MAPGEVPLDAVPHPALIVDGSGAVRATNAAVDEQWAADPDALADVFVDEDRAATVVDTVGEAAWTGRCRLEDRRDRWAAAVRARPTGEDSSLVVARDASEQRIDERDAQLLRSLLSEVPVSVYFKDTESRHIRVSQDLAADMRPNDEGKIVHTPADVEGKTEFDLYPPDVAEPAVADDREVMESETAIEGLVERVERPNGEILYITTSKAPWYGDDGEVRGVVGVSVETTAQKRQAEELKRQNERLEAFAGAVSHDLRNPLEVATANLELYRDTGEDGHLATVERMHDRMSTLIDDALELARGGEPVTDPEPTAVAEVAREAWAAVDTDEATLAEVWDGTIPADRRRLCRLFENCFRNAVEHAGSDATVRVLALETGHGFAIEDDGPGIPPKDRESVFERGVSTSEDGTGFGLSIVAEIADAHGWDIEVDESAAGGARFVFRGA